MMIKRNLRPDSTVARTKAFRKIYRYSREELLLAFTGWLQTLDEDPRSTEKTTLEKLRLDMKRLQRDMEQLMNGK